MFNKANGKTALIVLVVLAANGIAESKGFGINSLLAKAGI